MLCSSEHVPHIMRGTFIEKGYRLNYTWQMCLKSLFRAHNETLNMWTHFIGFLIFFGLLIHTIVYAVEEHTPMPIFAPSNITLTHKFTNENIFQNSKLPISIDYPHCSYNRTNFTSFQAFPSHQYLPFSFSNFSFGHFPSFYNRTFFNFSNHFPFPFSFDFVNFQLQKDYYLSYFNNTGNHNFTEMQAHMEEAMHKKVAEMELAMHEKMVELELAVHAKINEVKAFLSEGRDHFKSKVHSLHETMEIYFKDFEKSVHDTYEASVHDMYEISHHPQESVRRISERLSGVRELFNESLAKFFSPKSKFPIMVFLFSGMVCFMFSTLYHTFGCQSEHHCAFYLKIDYSGISTLIAGSLVPFVWYVFHGLTHWQCFYVVTLFLLASLVLYVSFSEHFSTAEYQPYRALCFVLMAGFSVVPFLHMVYLYGTVEIHSFSRMALSALLYVLGVVAYISRIPERLFPGKCDFWLQSHQVFHTFIVAAALVWYSFALRLLNSHAYVN